MANESKIEKIEKAEKSELVKSESLKIKKNKSDREEVLEELNESHRRIFEFILKQRETKSAISIDNLIQLN